jgi:glycerol-3-phosphate dehydrogenase
MIGTTDIRFDDDPDEARCSAAEMNYLLNEVNALIPQAGLTPGHVLFTFSGVRPLPYAPGVVEAKIPRSHVLHDHGPGLAGLVSVVGGKLTTFRQLAEDAVDDVFKRLGRKSPPCTTGKLPSPGAVFDATALRAHLSGLGLGEKSMARLMGLYGGRARDVVAEAKADPALLRIIHPDTGAIGAEMVFALRHEFATSLADVMARRTLLAFAPGHGLESLGAIADLLAHSFNWDGARRAAEIRDYEAWLSHLAVPGRTGIGGVAREERVNA